MNQTSSCSNGILWRIELLGTRDRKAWSYGTIDRATVREAICHEKQDRLESGYYLQNELTRLKLFW